MAFGPDTTAGYFPGGDGYGVEYDNWDAHMTTQCVCDIGFFGADCSLRMCPKGDDPLTTAQNTRTILMKLNSTGGNVEGYYSVGFDGEKFQLPVNATELECEAGWESLPNLEDVTCSVTYDGLGTVYTVELDAFPPLPYQNNIFSHFGNPGLSSFSCDISHVSTYL